MISVLIKFDYNLYMNVNNEMHVFRNITSMNLDKGQKVIKDKDGNQIQTILSPHFIYNDMIYYNYDELENDIPKGFEEVGKIKEEFARADKNFTGNIELGSKIKLHNE